MRFSPEKIKPGDVVEIGPHRIACGDSTNRDHVAALMKGDQARLLHADPPYGMGKEFDNDDKKGAELEAFNTAWFAAWLPTLHKYASAYIWGNAQELWRWYYGAGANLLRDWKFCNMIIWDKPAMGRGSKEQRVYPHAYETALFLQRNWRKLDANVGNFWPGWEPLRAYLDNERIEAGLTKGQVNRLTGTSMAGHWFTRHQWQMITEEHYLTLRQYTKGRHFRRPYSELKRQYEELKRQFYEEERPYFDCSHGDFYDVWRDTIVMGPARYGHETPKPLTACARIARTSAPKGGIVADPFAGSGAMAVACHRTGRLYRGMDISPDWVAVTANRLADEIAKETTQLFIWNE